jgi:aryl-alcohol dehydrogenase-like predicted oxidoreductase
VIYGQVGRSGVRISRIALGTLNFGPETSVADSRCIMDRALDMGINLFDTANVYGWQAGKGVTETIIGDWLAQGGGRRDKIVLASKVYMQTGAGPNDGGLSAQHIRKACDDSLRRLQTDHIDIYQMHHIDRATPWDEIWQAFATLQRQGKIIHVGSSNFAGWHLTQAQEAARARAMTGIISEQSLYNLCYRQVETDVLPACRQYGIGLLVWGTLNRGFLANPARDKARGPRAAERLQREFERFGTRLAQYVRVCEQLGARPADVATAWALQQPGVAAVIAGPRTLDQLEDSVRCLDVTLDAAALQAVNDVWPGPRGPAPEAYAW